MTHNSSQTCQEIGQIDIVLLGISPLVCIAGFAKVVSTCQRAETTLKLEMYAMQRENRLLVRMGRVTINDIGGSIKTQRKGEGFERVRKEGRWEKEMGEMFCSMCSVKKPAIYHLNGISITTLETIPSIHL